MESKKTILVGGYPGDYEYLTRLIGEYSQDPAELDFNQGGLGDCKQDHGERTNYKLRDQPFYMRGRNGKMRNY